MDARRRQILHDLGIDVWRQRPGADVAPVAREPAQPAVAREPTEPAAAQQHGTEAVAAPAQTPRLAFDYVGAGGGICLYNEVLGTAHQQFVRDLVSACVRLTDTPAERGIEFSRGEFRWPIVGTGGSPQRALRAFFEKQGVAGDGCWILATPAVLADIRAQVEPAARVVEIPEIARLAGDATLKKALWQRLKQDLG